MVKLVRVELSPDMKDYTDDICRSLKSQGASGSDYKEAAHMVAKRFSSTAAAQSKIEKATLDYMLDQKYVTRAMLDAGIIDENGIEVLDPDATLPAKVAKCKYGCHIQFSESADLVQLLELLYDQDFIQVSAFELKQQGVLYTTKDKFFANPRNDCSEWARAIVEDYPGSKVGRTFNVVWSQLYDIQVSDDSGVKSIKYHKLK